MENQDELIAQIQQGDADAMSQLVKAELPRVYNLCLKLCRKPEDAEDLCQDVFTRAVRSVKNFKGHAAISTWLYRITINTWKNRIRYENRRRSLLHVSIFGNDKTGEEGGGIDIEDDAPRPDAQVEKKEAHRQVLLALDHLKPDDKTIIVLRDIEGKSYEEIAEIMALSLGTVKSRLARAREQFRDAYKIVEVQHP